MTDEPKPKHAGGRPIEYSAEKHVPLVHAYLASRQDGLDPVTGKIKVALPTLDGCSTYLGINRDTLYEWQRTYREFSEALELIVKEQQMRLLDSGLAGTYNHVIAKLVLSANHGMRERQDITSDNKPLPTPILGIEERE